MLKLRGCAVNEALGLIDISGIKDNIEYFEGYKLSEDQFLIKAIFKNGEKLPLLRVSSRQSLNETLEDLEVLRLS